MEQWEVERKLAAILAADVAGYSRLMGSDEAGTLTALKAHRRALVDPKIKEHRGKIIKTTGDGRNPNWQARQRQRSRVLAATAQNLRKLVKLIGSSPPPLAETCA